MQESRDLWQTAGPRLHLPYPCSFHYITLPSTRRLSTRVLASSCAHRTQHDWRPTSNGGPCGRLLYTCALVSTSCFYSFGYVQLDMCKVPPILLGVPFPTEQERDRESDAKRGRSTNLSYPSAQCNPQCRSPNNTTKHGTVDPKCAGCSVTKCANCTLDLDMPLSGLVPQEGGCASWYCVGFLSSLSIRVTNF